MADLADDLKDVRTSIVTDLNRIKRAVRMGGPHLSTIDGLADNVTEETGRLIALCERTAKEAADQARTQTHGEHAGKGADQAGARPAAAGPGAPKPPAGKGG